MPNSMCLLPKILHMVCSTLTAYASDKCKGEKDSTPVKQALPNTAEKGKQTGGRRQSVNNEKYRRTAREQCLFTLRAQVLLASLTTTLWYSCVSVIRDSVTGSSGIKFSRDEFHCLHLSFLTGECQKYPAWKVPLAGSEMTRDVSNWQSDNRVCADVMADSHIYIYCFLVTAHCFVRCTSFGNCDWD